MSVRASSHVCVLLTCLLAVVLAAAASASEASQPIRSESEVLPLTYLEDPQAVCIDGSPAAYYFRPSRVPNATRWLIALGGGAWCWSEENCYYRSNTTYGSSKSWSPNVTRGAFGSGLLSDNCTVNPAFCEFHALSINYCDGNSFSGMRQDPIAFHNNNDNKSTLLYLRGKYILTALLEATLVKHGAAVNASEFVLTGGSAGGLAVFLHAEYLHTYLRDRIPTLRHFSAIPVSGYFLDQPNIRFDGIFPSHLRDAFYLHNSSGGVSQSCVAAMGPDNAWRCNFAEYVYPFISTSTPMFVFNSMTDFWQLTCILNVEHLVDFANASFLDIINGNCSMVPGYTCLNWTGFDSCTTTQIQPALDYQASFLDRVFGDLTNWNAATRGAFLTSCFTHCEAMDDEYFTSILVDGRNMSSALLRWYRSAVLGNTEEEGKDTPLGHFHVDCNWNSSRPHSYSCNPTCPVS